MNFAERIAQINRERISHAPIHQADGKTCVFCGCTGSLVRESDFHYHDRTRLDVAIGLIHVVSGSMYCDFCQQEQPKTEVNKAVLCEGETLRPAKQQAKQQTVMLVSDSAWVATLKG